MGKHCRDLLGSLQAREQFAPRKHLAVQLSLPQKTPEPAASQLRPLPRDQKGLWVGAQRSPLSRWLDPSCGVRGGVLHSLFPAGCNTSHSPSRTSCSYSLFCSLGRDLVTQASPPRSWESWAAGEPPSEGRSSGTSRCTPCFAEVPGKSHPCRDHDAHGCRLQPPCSLLCCILRALAWPGQSEERELIPGSETCWLHCCRGKEAPGTCTHALSISS